MEDSEPLAPWDSAVEQLTALANAMSDGRGGRGVLVAGDAWRMEVRATRKDIAVVIRPRAPGARPRLDDYQLVLIYGCGYQPLGAEGQPEGFAKSLGLKPGFQWDEQTLREVLLEAVALHRHVLGVQPAGLEVIDETRSARIPIGRPPGRRRR